MQLCFAGWDMTKIAWGIDVGVGSLALAVIELGERREPIGLLDGVVEIFPASAGAAERREHEATRTQLRRRSQRLRLLKERLTELFKLPSDFNEPQRKPARGRCEDNSRIALRARGLQASLSPVDLARAILHIAQNRGQRLARAIAGSEEGSAEAKAEKKEATETQDRAQRTTDLLGELGTQRELARPAHPAELLSADEAAGRPTRLRKDRPDAPVFTRRMIEAEFEALMQVQATSSAYGYHRLLDAATREELHDLVFYEAPPKPPRVGKCRFRVRGADGEIEDRLPVGSDLFQTKRVYEEINNLRLIDPLSGATRPLKKDERDRLADAALAGRDIKGGTVRTILKLGRGRDALQNSLDIAQGTKGRKAEGTIKGHQIAAAFRKAGAADRWASLSSGRKTEIADLLRLEDDFDALQEALTTLDLSWDEARAVANAPISSARSAAGPTATHRLLKHLRAGVVSAYEAADLAGLEDPTLEIPRLDRLPYYGAILVDSCVGATNNGHDPLETQYGRIANPIVHQALNRLRKIGNAFLKHYGKPERICIELARDLNKSSEERAEDERRAAANGRRNDLYLLKLLSSTAHARRRLSRDDYLKIRLHRLQNGRCLYTGAELSVENLFDGSTAVDHILPRAETLDDSLANLALTTRRANDHKGKRTPYDAFSAGYLGHPYAQILERAKARGLGVYWRFQPDAMARFRDRADFRERFLVDTRYIGKAARRYLATVCADPNGVVCVNGRLTALLRRHWGLDGLIRDIMEETGALDPEPPKPADAVAQIARRRERQKKLRLDHRHHLLDAIVAGCTTRADVQRVSTIAARFNRTPTSEELERTVEDYLAEFQGAGLPWSSEFRGATKALLTNDPVRFGAEARPASRVLHRANHNPLGALHAASNYGAICRDPTNPDVFVVTQHKALADLATVSEVTKALDGLDDIGRAETILRAALEADAPRWWGGHDPLAALDNLRKDLAGLKAEILAHAHRAPESVGSEPAKRLKWAIEKHVQETGRRRYTQVSVMSARILKRGPTPTSCPVLLTPTKAKNSNHCLDLYRTVAGEIGWRVTARLDANLPGGLDPRPGETPILRLHANDLVEMLDGDGPSARRRLYRLVSLSKGDLEFLPVEEARSTKEAPKGVSARINSVGALRARKPARIILDSAGRVRWRSAPLN